MTITSWTRDVKVHQTQYVGKPYIFRDYVPTGRRQRPIDFSRNLPYERRLSKSRLVYGYTGPGYTGTPLHPSSSDSTAYFDGVFGPLPEYERTFNRARSKLMDRVTTRAQLGATVAEWRSSADMITSRVGQLIRAYRNLRRGNLQRFFRELELVPKNRHKGTRWSRPAQASSLWLEYWFGWSPLIQDIYGAVETLGSPIPDTPITATSQGRYKVSKIITNTATNYVRRDIDVQVAWKLQALAQVSNPAAFERNRLGLLNPATIVWELVPFSFMVDWFYPVGTFLEGFTDTVGLTFDKDATYQTKYVWGKGSETSRGNRNHPTAWTHEQSESELHWIKREVGTISRPSLQLMLPTKLSRTRAATSVSLLISLFSPTK